MPELALDLPSEGRQVRAVGSDKLSDRARAAKFNRWERIGINLIRADLQRGGRFIVGSTARSRALAEEWLQRKDAEKLERAASLERARQENPISRLLNWTTMTLSQMGSRH